MSKIIASETQQRASEVFTESPKRRRKLLCTCNCRDSRMGIEKLLQMGCNPSLSPTDIHNIITNTAKKLGTLDGRCYSKGILDAYKAYKVMQKKEVH